MVYITYLVSPCEAFLLEYALLKALCDEIIHSWVYFLGTSFFILGKIVVNENGKDN